MPRIDDVVVEVVRDGIGDGEEQAVAVLSAAARPPAITSPVITKGRPAISGVASTTKSVLFTTKSAHWTIPSPFLSTRRRGRRASKGHPPRQLGDLAPDELGVDGERAKAARPAR
jgi:hypothetical protein